MNTRMKIAAAVIAGAIAGSALMGSALAAPRTSTQQTPDTSTPLSYGMMRSLSATSGAFAGLTIDEMVAFMNQYRQADGSIDVTRMHRDVSRRAGTPPCLPKTKPASGPAQPSSGAAPTYRSMMGSVSGSGTQSGYTMMGRSY